MNAAPKFLEFYVPAYAVACPDCKARIGVGCKRPSGHNASTFHKARGREADRLWLIHDCPTITRKRNGKYVYDGPETRPSVTCPEERDRALKEKRQ